MSRLEQRYRLVLRLLPAAYRRQWEQDMVAAFLASMHSGDPETDEFVLDYGRPSLAEIASIVSLAARLRLGGGVQAPPRFYAWGQAIRLATLMMLLTNAVMVTGNIAITLWQSGAMAWLPAPAPELALSPPRSLWHIAANLTGCAWLPAYLALVLGHRRLSQGLALLAIIAASLVTAVEQATDELPLIVLPWAVLLLDTAVLLAMAAFHRAAPPVPRRPWLLALPAGVLLVPLPLFGIQATNQTARLLDWPGLSCILITIVIATYLAGRGFRRPSRSLPWPLALTLLAGTSLGLRIVTLPNYNGQTQYANLTTIAAAQIIAVLAVGLPLAVHTIRAMHHLPDVAFQRG